MSRCGICRSIGLCERLATELTYGESLLGLRPGQRISVRDLLFGLILRSGNDAAYDLAPARHLARRPDSSGR